ncbi:MAG: hypothetical protein FWH53_00735 [Leptospirales bacterium]|nr:hypothetical protein [Leptospirales bacterium]
MKEKDKVLISKAILYVSDVSYWGGKLIREYLRNLKNKDNSITIGAKPVELQSKIFDWIDSTDSDLSVFYKYYKIAEAERAKTIKLFKIPDKYKDELSKIIQGSNTIEYDPYSSGARDNPKIVYTEKKEDKIEIWFAIKSKKDTSATLDIDELNPAFMDTLLEQLKKNNPNAENITKVQVGYLFTTRIINILTIDVKNNNICVSTDQPKLTDPDNDELHNVNPEDRLLPFVAKAVEKLGIKESENFKNDIEKERRISRASIKNIKTTETKDCLILPYSFELLYETGDASERNIDKFFKLTIGTLKPLVAEFYNNNGTFIGFLKENETLDVERHGLLLKTIRSVPNVESIGQNFFIFLHNDDKELECARISCNMSTGHLRVMLEKGSNIHEKIYSRLDKIFP